MSLRFTFVRPNEWVKGDYRYGAQLAKGSCSVETLAAIAGGSVERYVEEGLGPAKCIGVRSEAGASGRF